MLDNLPSDGVLVFWTAYSDTGSFSAKEFLARFAGTRTLIGGRPAKIEVVRYPGRTLASINAYVFGHPGLHSVGWYEMGAQTGGANSARFQAQVQAMLRSVSFHTPAR